MTTGKSITVVPAYGRDYTSEKDALNAWYFGKDFKIAYSDTIGGNYVSIRDLPNDITEVRIRYNKKTRVAIVES